MKLFGLTDFDRFNVSIKNVRCISYFISHIGTGGIDGKVYPEDGSNDPPMRPVMVIKKFYKCQSVTGARLAVL